MLDENKMYRSHSREMAMWGMVVIFQIAIILAIGILLKIAGAVIFGWTVPMSITCTLGTIAWALYFFNGGIDYFIVNVADFHGAVLSNRFRSVTKPVNDDARLNLKPSKALEEIGQGLHPVYPWQNRTFIDLRREITMSNTVTTYSLDNIEVSVKWVMLVTPLRGFLCFLVQNTEEESKSLLRSIVEGQLTSKLNGLNQAQILIEFTDIKSWFGVLFGGDDVSSEIEKQCGMSTSRLTLTDYKRSERFQDSVEALAIAGNTAAAVRNLIEAGSTDKQPISGQHALNAILATEEVADMNIIQISGLEGVTTIGGNISFGSGGKKKDDKK